MLLVWVEGAIKKTFSAVWLFTLTGSTRGTDPEPEAGGECSAEWEGSPTCSHKICTG